MVAISDNWASIDVDILIRSSWLYKIDSSIRVLSIRSRSISFAFLSASFMLYSYSITNYWMRFLASDNSKFIKTDITLKNKDHS